ncbi:hypothetical protein, partial [Imhoffiella purpurea]|uniref:hypothetical protein n=1 Tax=Imhoffiella purpurea TaxID=1249627 RepID=UPI001E60CA38
PPDVGLSSGRKSINLALNAAAEDIMRRPHPLRESVLKRLGFMRFPSLLWKFTVRPLISSKRSLTPE